jgi:YfiH family protein
MPAEATLPRAIRPDWPAPAAVSALMSTREGGVSAPPFDSLNLRPAELPGDLVDDPAAIAENQRRFAAALGAKPVWLEQVHGADVVRLTQADLAPGRAFRRADAAISTEPGVGCVVQVADCLPVLLCDRGGRVVGAAHAGWRGLAAGVLERSVASMCGASGLEPDQLLAWLGPCIGPRQFEVGADVLAAFGADAASPDPARFVARPRPDGAPRWLANLPQLARDRLREAGVTAISGGAWCTVEEPSRFFSFRRDRITGRLAAGIALRD